MSLENKRILLIAAKFFGYEKDIQNEILSRGARVDAILDRPFNSAFMKAFTKAFPSVTQLLVYAYYLLFFPDMFNQKYDHVFVVEGITLSRRVLTRLKKNNPDCKFTLYVWDSIKNRPHIYDNKDCYHEVFTFDPRDSKRFGFKFRPLFFTKDFERKNNVLAVYDLSFVATVHSDRFDVLSNMLKTLSPSLRKYAFLYFHAQWFYLYNKLFNRAYRGSKKSDFKFTPLSKKEVSNIIASSAVTLDVEHPGQVGLTMRTFEVLGEGRKLITTNSSITEYDFYNPNNIAVIDRKNPRVPESFFETPYEELSPSIYQKYSLSSWVSEILEAN